MKILFIGMSSNIGGIESFIINTYKVLHRNGIGADFIAFEDHICFEDEILESGAHIYRLPYRKTHPISYLYNLYSFFKTYSYKYDIVHINLNNCSAIEPVIFSSFFGNKTIAHSHNSYQSKKIVTKFLNGLNKRILPFFTKNFIACSLEAGYSMFGKYPFTFIPNGIDVRKYKYSSIWADTLKRKYNLKNKLVIGHVGRLNYQKNQVYLIKIFNEIHKVNHNTKLVLVGEGDDEEKLKKMVKEYSLQNNVVFYGKTKHVEQVLNLFDIVIFPSLFEGLPISLIEFQANGLPCLISDCITKQIQVTDLVYPLSLTMSVKKWADMALAIIKQTRKKREMYNDIMLKSSFSLNYEYKQLMNYYKSL